MSEHMSADPVVGVAPSVDPNARRSVVSRLAAALGGIGVTVEALPPDWSRPSGPTLEHSAIVVMAEPVTAELLDRAPRLRQVCRWGAGMDSIDTSALARRGVAVTATRGSGVSVAGAALSLVLALAYELPRKRQMARDGRWDERRLLPGRGIEGTTVGIVGLGVAGTRIAEVLATMGARILGVSGHGAPTQPPAVAVELVPLGSLAERSDYVVLTCPLTNETRGLVSTELLTSMKPTAALVNVARGGLIDHEALLVALAEERLSGVGLDVTDPEPLPPRHPLLLDERVIVTPHALAHTEEAMEANFRNALEQLSATIPTVPAW